MTDSRLLFQAVCCYGNVIAVVKFLKSWYQVWNDGSFTIIQSYTANSMCSGLDQSISIISHG